MVILYDSVSPAFPCHFSRLLHRHTHMTLTLTHSYHRVNATNTHTKDTSIKLVYSFTFKCLATNSTAALYPYTPIPQTTATALSLK